MALSVEDEQYHQLQTSLSELIFQSPSRRSVICTFLSRHLHRMWAHSRTGRLSVSQICRCVQCQASALRFQDHFVMHTQCRFSGCQQSETGSSLTELWEIRKYVFSSDGRLLHSSFKKGDYLFLLCSPNYIHEAFCKEGRVWWENCIFHLNMAKRGVIFISFTETWVKWWKDNSRWLTIFQLVAYFPIFLFSYFSYFPIYFIG